MKSLHVIDHYCIGGAQRIVQGILMKLPDARLLPLRQKGSASMQFDGNEEFYLSKPSKNPLRQFLTLVKIPSLLVQENIQIIHCHLHVSWLFGVFVHLILRAHAPIQLILHEHDSTQITRWYYPLLVRWFSQFGTFVAVSYFIQNRLTACGLPPEKVILLRNFVDLERFHPTGKRFDSPFGIAPQLLENRRRIGFAGRLVKYKGWQVILQLATMFPEICFLIAGDGKDFRKLSRKIRQQNLQDRVFPLGYVQNMASFFHQIDLLIIPSFREAFGLVQLEAQACGLPIVVFDNEAAKEIHGDNSSYLVRNGDVELLAYKAKELLENPILYTDLIQKGLANAHLYNLTDYAKQLEHIYRDILNV